jgi:very-short-patch-repair endonuclease
LSPSGTLTPINATNINVAIAARTHTTARLHHRLPNCSRAHNGAVSAKAGQIPERHKNGLVARPLWRALRERFVSWKFRRHHPIGRRIADFACPARKLVIELDGGQHGEQLDADDRRNAELARYGYRVIRFWNNEVLENLEGVLETIRQHLEAPPPCVRGIWQSMRTGGC